MRSYLRPTVILFLSIQVVAVVTLVAACFERPPWEYVLWAYLFWRIRIFGIGAGYHRYFSHKSFKTSRMFQFVLALLGASAVQKGALWWAGNHRDHHKYSDKDGDPHSPVLRTFWYAHIGWVIDSNRLEVSRPKDFTCFWELRALERVHWLPGTIIAFLVWWFYGLVAVGWIFFVSTLVTYHSTFLVNSLCHVWGKRRFNTTDWSVNSWLAGLLDGGEGWHNNHHHRQGIARQGRAWYEVDTTYYAILLLEFLGIVWDVKKPEKPLRVEIAKARLAPRITLVQPS